MNNSDSRLRLVWLREGPGGRLDCDLGVPVAPDGVRALLRQRLGLLDPQVFDRAADHILAALADTSATEVHLPFIHRNEWKQRGLILQDAAFASMARASFPRT